MSTRARSWSGTRNRKEDGNKPVKRSVDANDTSDWVERAGRVSTGVSDRVAAVVSDRPNLLDGD